MLAWYTLNSKPHQEEIVQNALNARGIETYLPLWRPPQVRKDRHALRPYFPCYLFAQADLDVVGLSTLKYALGVRQVVLRGDRPAAVDRRVIEELQERIALLCVGVVDPLGRKLHRGDRVVIRSGLFEGYEGIFDSQLSSGTRVRVLVNFLQHQTPCELDAAWIEKQVPKVLACR